MRRNEQTKCSMGVSHERQISANERNVARLMATLKALPGYPWLPCPICHGVEGCDHSVTERARTAHPGLAMTF